MDAITLLETDHRKVKKLLAEGEETTERAEKTRAQLYATLAAQRASKILGIFARLEKRDGKPQYVRHMPRVWAYLRRALSHPSLSELQRWYRAHVPALRV